VLHNNSLLNIGDTYIVVSLVSDEKDRLFTNENNSQQRFCNNNIIHLKIFSGDENYDPLNFQPSKSAIKIGRSNDCEVFIDDKRLSRVQCMIEFDNNVGWTIRDGNFYREKNMTEFRPSSNGTWYVMKTL